MSERIYYSVHPHSAVMAVIQDTIATNRQALNVIDAFKVKQGGSAMYVSQPASFAGLAFEGDIPKGWRQDLHHPFCVPNLRTNAGKLVQAEIDLFPKGIDGLGFAYDLGEELGSPEAYVHFGGNVMAWAHYGVYGDTTVLAVPVCCKVVPPDCTELKISEFQKLEADSQAERKEAA